MPADALYAAAEIAERSRQDELAADAAREAYRRRGIPTLAPDGTVAAHLGPDERVHAVRTTALLEPSAVGGSPTAIRGGTLYLTSERLLLLGEPPADRLEIPLARIEETSIAVERLVLIRLDDGTGHAIEAGQPRLLRVQIAAAVTAQRTSR